MTHQKKRGKQGRGKTTPGPLPLQPAPGRAADHPFCAYMGAHGETCAETTQLEEVFVIEGAPRLIWLACPLHREAVHQLAASFVLRSQTVPGVVRFRYQGEIYHVQVNSARIPNDEC